MQTQWNIRLVVAAVAWAAAYSALATERHVPSEYGTIQAAIDACVAGDVVIVADGTYTGAGNKDLNFGGRAITVRSASGNPATCTIDCQGTGRGFYFNGDETAASVVQGLTIRNGNSPSVYCSSSSPTLTNCTITGNKAVGVYCTYSSPTLTNCTITDNNTDGNGCGVQCNDYSSPTLTNCTIRGNSTSFSYGGGMFCSDSSPKLTSCILWANTPQQILAPSGSPVVTFCDVQGGWGGTGNINADPGFAFPEDDHLLSTSPCIDAGTNSPPGGLPPNDPDGQPRPLDGDGNGSAVADMGVYEFNRTNSALALSTTELVYYVLLGQTSSQTLAIRNSGLGTLAWGLGWEVDWLTADPVAGESAGEVDTVTLTAGTAGLTHGTYITTLRVNAPQAFNAPRAVAVVVHVLSSLHVPSQYPTIQAAIDAATEPGDEVVIADGAYTGVGNKDLDSKGKAITVRSASGNPATCIIDCQGTGRGFYFHSGETATSVVQGLTIRNGSGGVYFSSSSPKLTNCTIAGNTANSGGGLYCDTSSSPTLTNCMITGNTANSSGGGLYCSSSSSPTLTNCMITGNTANSSGGGLYCSSSSPTLTNCTITGNTANSSGGGVYCSSSSPTLTNCTITGNTANSSGGGVYCYSYSHPKLTNCTITGNSGGNGGGVSSLYYDASPTLTNCILWANTSQQIYLASGAVTYCDVQGGWSGTGNIDANPGFAFPNDAHLLSSSPCIDAGSNSPSGGLPPQDLDGQPRPLDGDGNGSAVADMGVYEFNRTNPALALSTTELVYYVVQGQTSLQTLGIRNSSLGASALAWALQSEADWLTADPPAGESVGEVDAITLTAHTAGLNHGTYVTTLWVNAPQACNAPRAVAVVLHVGAPRHVPGQYATIQAAIDATLVPGNEVIVADGVYIGAGNKDLDFAGKAITVRAASGDPRACVIDCQGSGRGFYFHSGEGAASIVQGLTIRNGNGNGGGGVYCSSSSPTLTNCAITGNLASGTSGGGVFCSSSSNPKLTNCTITGNNASSGGGLYCSSSGLTLTDCTITGNNASSGGGLCCSSSGLTLTDCTITGNTASSGGGLYCSASSSLILTNCSLMANTAQTGGGVYFAGGTLSVNGCLLSGNAAASGGAFYLAAAGTVSVGNSIVLSNRADGFLLPDGTGGGVACRAGNPRFANSVFARNIATNDGAAVYSDESDLTLVNCTVASNMAIFFGGGLRVGGASGRRAYTSNCILWGNSSGLGPELALLGQVEMRTAYCDMQGGPAAAYVAGTASLFWGLGNIDADPHFSDSQTDSYALLAGSPCIDAGDNFSVLGTLDLAGHTRKTDDPATPDTGLGTPPIVDLGAYEFQPAGPPIPGDLNGDGWVDATDFALFEAGMGGPDVTTPPAGCDPAVFARADLNGDGDVDAADFAAFQRAFNSSGS